MGMGIEEKIIYLPLKAIKPYKKNPRKNDKAVEFVANSIRQFGFRNPIIIDENYEIVCGHTRWKAAKVIGLESVPCIMADDLNEDQIRAFRLADNKTAEMADWDFDLLELEFNDIDPDLFDMADFGFFQDDEQEEQKPTEVTEDDFDESTVTESVCKRGQIWQLGDHRLMCGDSTSAEDVARLMNGEKADMVFTDPPYGVNYAGGVTIENGKIKSNDRETIKNDALGYHDLYSFLSDVFSNLRTFTKVKTPFYVFYAHSRTREFLNAFHDEGLKQRSIIIWHKIGGGYGDFMAQYMNAYEPCIYGSNGDSVNWYGPTNEKTVWEIEKADKNDLHPTMKPVALCGRAIQNSSLKNDIVLDLFGGSGTTLIACEQTGRQCRMMELDPHYCDVIIRRWEDFTGQKAELLEE